jgi:hypothetical protein
MVERERDEGEAARALISGPPQQQQQQGAAEGEKAGDEREEDDRDDEAVEWSEIRLAIEELSPPARLKHGGGGDGKADASSLPTLPFLALSHLLLRVLGEFQPPAAMHVSVLRLALKPPLLLDPLLCI